MIKFCIQQALFEGEVNIDEYLPSRIIVLI